MFDWDDLRFFVELARCGSLSEAARRLKADHSTVARRIAALEAALGTRLFDRMPRGYVLTAEGARLIERATGVEDAVLAVERAAAGTSDRIEGTVRISAPPAFASHWLVPRLTALRHEHPGLILDVAGETATASLMRRDADIALRLSRPVGDALVARKLGTLRYGLYGARAYLDSTAEDDRAFLGYDEHLADVPQQRWLLKHAAGRRLAMLSNDLSSLIAGTRAGIGLAVIPHALAASHDELVCVCEAPEAAREVWSVVHPDLRHSLRIRVVLDYLTEITSALRA